MPVFLYFCRQHKHLRILLILIVCSLLSLTALAQLDNSSLFYNDAVDTTREKSAFLKIQNLNFLKNNEYYNPIADGYTMLGVQLNPQLGYQVTKNISVEGGIFLSKDFGNKDFTIIAPSFSFRYRKNDFKMVFGNIDGSLNHQLIEPLYNFERVITNRLESGVQFVVNKKYYDFDLWVDWQNAIYRYSYDKEHIWGGISANILKFKNEKAEFRVPLQMTVYHEGGQIDTLKSVGITKNFNYSPGLFFKYNLNAGFVKSIYADGRYVIRTNNYNDTIEVKSNGNGVMGNIGITTAKSWNLMFSYWYGNNFYNEFGGFLYSSKSKTVAYPYYSQRYRSILFMRLTKIINLSEKVIMTLRAEPHYDFYNEMFEFSFGLYIKYDDKLWFRK